MEYLIEDGERRGGGVAENGVGLLNGQTTKRYSIAFEEGDGLFTVNTAWIKVRGSRR
jgi:hypothetical protein